MIDLEHHVKQCAQVGHVYYHVWSVRCGHREAITLFGRVWVDGPHDDTMVIHEERHEFGPFDAHAEILAVYNDISSRCVRAQLTHTL